MVADTDIQYNFTSNKKIKKIKYLTSLKSYNILKMGIMLLPDTINIHFHSL